MSIFNEIILPKITDITNNITKNANDNLKAAFECLDKFEEEFLNGRSKTKSQKDKLHVTTLQSINEDDGEKAKTSDTDSTKGQTGDKSTDATITGSSVDTTTGKPRRASKKRSKNEVDGITSPEQDKRQKRSASVKAQGIISKQVNVNLTQKLRREDPDNTSISSQRKEDEKENMEPLPNIQIKQEKISIPPEPELMDMESLPVNIGVKQEPNKDDFAMPPPLAPVPKTRAKTVPKEKPSETPNEEEPSGRRRTTRTRKQTDTAPVPAPASARSSRSNSRATKQAETEEPAPPPPESRPKRTRAKKKVSEGASQPEKEPEPTQSESVVASPTEKPRPKRTRRAQKAAEKAEQKAAAVVTPKDEPITHDEVSSPILCQPKDNKKHADKSKVNLTTITISSSVEDTLDKTKILANNDTTQDSLKTKKQTEKMNLISQGIETNIDECDAMDKTRVIGNANDMDKTVVLPNGVYNHDPITPKNVRNMNETVVIEAATRETIVLDKPKNVIMDATVVLDKEPRAENVTDDNSLLTDDSDSQEFQTPPKQEPPKMQPTSAVKEKVQQFEEMATRATRTKTRAMAKKEEETETHTPPDRIVKQVLSAETLTKMNNMIFNGKQISSSATKPRSNIPTAKPLIPASASKVSSINKAREEADAKKEREDARKKKEAMLEAKREMHKRKREEKMAAAAAAREAAEKERQAAMEAAAKERMEKQAHADLGKLERLKEAERKKQELARKVAGTEERRRAEEHARQQRLAEEQRKAEEARKKQLEEAAAMKKEAAIMAKEIEKRQKEYIEKQKLKRMEEKNHTPMKTPGAGWHGTAADPVYMADGFQYLNSDEDEEPVERPVPEWSTSKGRKQQLYIQSLVSNTIVDKFFSVRVHTPDLRDIFPNIERSRLKRTSSAVWRTPPARLDAVTE